MPNSQMTNREQTEETGHEFDYLIDEEIDTRLIDCLTETVSLNKWLTNCMIVWLAHWLNHRLTDWKSICLNDGLTVCLTHEMTKWLFEWSNQLTGLSHVTEWMTDSMTAWLTDWPTGSSVTDRLNTII